jgi:Family of unknown function (DUF6272)
MDRLNLYSLNERFNQDGILICFTGPFSHSIIEELGNAVKKYLESEQVSRAAMMDVFSIFIELTQNIRNYAAVKEMQGNRSRDFGSGIIVIGKTDDEYIVSSGNFVEAGDLDPLVKKLDSLSGMTREQLKAVWKSSIRQETPPGALGAGLGFIDMSRKSSKPLEYSINLLDGHHAFFSIKATI